MQKLLGMSKPPLENLIEAALFFKGGTLSYKELAEAIESTVEEVKGGVQSLKVSLEGRGLSIVIERDEVALATEQIRSNASWLARDKKKAQAFLKSIS